MLAPGTILVADRGAQGGAGALLAVDPQSGAPRVLSSGQRFTDPSGVVVQGDGNVLVVDSGAFGGTGGVIRVDPTSGAQTPFAHGGLLESPFAAALEADGTIVVVGTGPTTVLRVDRNGDASKVLPEESLSSAVDLAVDRDGSLLVVANVEAGGELLRLDRTTGRPSPVPGADFQNLVGITLAPDGTIWALEDRHGVGSSVARFDPVSRQRTTVTAGNLLRGPFRLVLEPGGTLVVSVPLFGEGPGRLVRVDPREGTQSLLAEGGLLVEPFGLAVA